MTGRQTRRNVLVPLLVLICSLLGTAVWAQWRDPDLLVRSLMVTSFPQPPVATTGRASPVKLATAAVPPESAFSVIAQRPLFMQSRRAPEKPDKPVTLNQTDTSLPNLVVTGIVMSGADSVAILEPVRTARRAVKRNGEPAEQSLIVRVGDTVGGWTVEAMEPNPDRVVLVRGNKRQALELVPDENRRRAGQRPVKPKRQTPPRLQPTQPGAAAPSGQTKADN